MKPVRIMHHATSSQHDSVVPSYVSTSCHKRPTVRPILKQESSSVSSSSSTCLESKRDGMPECQREESPCSSRTNKRVVYFDNVTIREFAYDIGDHPLTSDGIPVSISWEYQDETTMRLDLYEHRKCSPTGFPPNVLSTQQRRDILVRAGYTPSDLEQAQRELELRRTAADRNRLFGRRRRRDSNHASQYRTSLPSPRRDSKALLSAGIVWFKRNNTNSRASCRL